MTDSIRAVCDECREEFDAKFKERKIGATIRETYFKCTSCHAVYTCYVTNTRARSLIKSNEKLRSKRELTSEDREAIKQNQEVIDAIMGELKTKYGR